MHLRDSQTRAILLRAHFREGDEDSNFSIFRVWWFSEGPEPLHWIAFPVEILTKPLIHWIASLLSLKNPCFSLQSAPSHPLPKTRLWALTIAATRPVPGSVAHRSHFVCKRHLRWLGRLAASEYKQVGVAMICKSDALIAWKLWAI